MNTAYAFFFNADHSSLDMLYGPPCTSKLISAMERSKSNIDTHILRGDLLPHTLAYKPTKVSTQICSADGTTTIQHSMSPDMELYKTILCDLSDSLQLNWCTINSIKFPFQIASKRIWTNVLTTISQEVAQEIDEKLKCFKPYIGATQIDTGNPIHINLFKLINGMGFRNGQLFFKSDADGNCSANFYEASNKPTILSDVDFYKTFPSSLEQTKLSDRGRLSASRLTGKSVLSHSEKLAYEILDYAHKNPGIKLDYNADTFPKDGAFLCEKKKIKDYLLNLDHPDGKSKAKFFAEILGIKREDWEYLIDQISEAMKDAIIFKVTNKKHGISHAALINIRGRNNRTTIIETGWIVETNNRFRLITAYPYKQDIKDAFDAPPENIAPLNLTGNDRWAYIYDCACRAGEKAAHNCTPTPMTLEGYKPIFGGACGFAWITVYDARTGMAKWLKDNNIGHKSYKSGWEISVDPKPNANDTWDSQSIAPKEAYAKAFEQVLLANKIKCVSHSRLD